MKKYLLLYKYLIMKYEYEYRYNTHEIDKNFKN